MSEAPTTLPNEACFACSVADASQMLRCPTGCQNTLFCGACAARAECPTCRRPAGPEDLRTDSDFSPRAASSPGDIGAVSLSLASDSGSLVHDHPIAASAGGGGIEDAPPLGVGGSGGGEGDAGLHVENALLYLAVPSHLQDAVLQEGFRTRWRNSVPVAGTEEQALRALARRSPEPAALLAVTSLRDGDGNPYTVTRGRRGGFRIRSPGLPGTCLSAVHLSSVAYVAVPLELRDIILQEGYQPTRRRSVPTSPSRAIAAEAFGRLHNRECEVLGVLLDPSIPRHWHAGGWKLRTPVLHRQYLRQLL